MIRRPLPLLLAACLATGLAGCGDATSPSTGETAPNGAHGERIGVVVGFYPLEYATARIGQDRVQVTNLTKPGVDPHDAELSARDVATVSRADLAVYEQGLQPAVDDAVRNQPPDHALDVGEAADLSIRVAEPVVGGTDNADHDHDHTEAPDHTHDPAGDYAEGSDDGHDHAQDAGAVDPHFWLDPIRYGAVGEAIAEQLAEIDPAGAQQYRQNAQELVAELDALDTEYRSALTTCESRDLVTAHSAFGYLAARYDLTQAGISGLSPEAEPDPRRLAAIADYAKTHGVRTIYSETLINPAVAQTVAAETGARTATLDPLESQTDAEADYFAVMRNNLQVLVEGQGCS